MIRYSTSVKWTLGALLGFLVAAGPSAAEGRRYVLDAARSSLTVRTGRAGLFGFAGHEHLVLATRIRGEVEADPTSLASSSVSVTVDAASLVVQADGEGDDVPKVQARMVGPDLLDVGRFPEIAFRSRTVTGTAAGASFDLVVSGDLTLHGATKPCIFRVKVELSGDTLTATGKGVLRQTTFGLVPVSVGGVVKVKDEVALDYKFVGIATR